jgi:hypothetical protein
MLLPQGQIRCEKKVMMIVPVNCQVDKTQHIAHEARRHSDEHLPIGAVRHFQFQDHNRDNDRNDTITERG